jgi:hypothetical protein
MTTLPPKQEDSRYAAVRQYSLAQILAVWAAAAIPMAVLAWVVAPLLGNLLGATVPSPLRVARACSAAPNAATPPSAYHLSDVLLRWPWTHSTSCTALSRYSSKCAVGMFSQVRIASL